MVTHNFSFKKFPETLRGAEVEAPRKNSRDVTISAKKKTKIKSTIQSSAKRISIGHPRFSPSTQRISCKQQIISAKRILRESK